MGNFSSCTASFDSDAPLAHPAPPSHAAKVLLVDGSMLKFKVPIKVINLLLDYPDHLVCPLDSLAPGLHSLSSLPPDAKLQMGRLYLLLPFKTNLQKSCIKGKEGMQQKGDPNKASVDAQKRGERTRQLLVSGGNLDEDLAKCAKTYKKGEVGLHGELSKLQSSSLVQQGEHACKKIKPGKCRPAGMAKSGVGPQDQCAELRKDGEAGADASRRREGSNGKLAERSTRKGMHSKSMDAKEGQLSAAGSKPACERGPLCDTPELQRAYRSFLLRRSCSWTPRLQPILERR